MNQCNNNVFSLDEITFIAGDFFTIEFTIYEDEDKSIADISEYDVSCVISILGHPNDIVLEKQGVKFDEGKYRIELSSDETINLNGKYVYQPLLILNETRQYRPAQGILTIIPAII